MVTDKQMRNIEIQDDVDIQQIDSVNQSESLAQYQPRTQATWVGMWPGYEASTVLYVNTST